MRRFVLLLPLLVGACTGIIGGDSSGSSSRQAPTSAPSIDGQVVVSSQIVRLTNVGYRNSLRDLFPGITLPTLTLPAAPTAVVYDNNAIAQAPTSTLIQAYQANAQAIAGAVLANLGTVLPCNASDDACATGYLTDLAARAYRHPLREDERARLTAGWQALRATNDIPVSLGVVIEAILQSPAFLYQIEEGTPVANNPAVARLTGNELGSRLATLLWSSIPDAALRSVADDDRLLDPKELDAQAQRLLDDPRAHESVAHMQYQWLRFNLLQKTSKDTALFPTWTDGTAPAMREATMRFVDHVFWEEGTFSSLFTDTHAFVNDLLAPYYGMSGTGPALTMTTVPAAQRAGILTQVGLLAAFAHETMESPVLRGVFVLDRILCAPPPPPPPDVPNLPPAATNGETTTTRERFEKEHQRGGCAGCHKPIDGVGFGFQHFDAVGKWRDIEGGKPVDATGTIMGSGDVDGPFNGANDLSAKLATSQRSSYCITKNWLQYALAIDPSATNDELVKPLQAGLGTTPRFRDLLLTIVRSSAFRYRTVTP
jgi:hypothetical protein